jgi:hypothetical protein
VAPHSSGLDRLTAATDFDMWVLKFPAAKLACELIAERKQSMIENGT